VTVQELGSLGELIAALATVATLVYLATQIRYARLAASDASRQARAESVREMQLVSLNNREFREAWNKADPGAAARMKTLSDRLGVSVGEAELIWHGCCAWTFIHWSQFRSMKTADDQTELENLVREFYSIPPMVVVWKHDPPIKALLDPGFVAWVDKTIATPRTP
jgi:hypothetical protein